MLLLFQNRSLAQPLSFPLAFDHLTTENGLSHSTVYALLQDVDGLFWIGTRYGLNRFDGYRCEVFLPVDGDTASLQGPTVLALLEDRRGRIWVGHREAGISIWDKNRGLFERFSPAGPPGLDWSKITVRSLFEDSRGWIWVGTLGAGAIVFDEKKQVVAQFCAACGPKNGGPSGNFVFDFLEDQQGRIWIATDGRGVQVFDPAAETTQKLDSPDPLNMNSFEKTLCADQSGNVWIGTSGSGLYRFDQRSGRFGHFFAEAKSTANGLSHNIVTDLALAPDGQLWIATDGGGLNIFDPNTQRFKQVAYTAGFPQSLNTNALYQLRFDRGGNLWVGSFNGGVNIRKAHTSPFLIHQNQSDFRAKGLRSVLAIEEAKNGRIWLGTDGNGLFFAEPTALGFDLTIAQANGKKIPVQVVTCLEATENGGLWIGTYAEGLCFWDGKNGPLRNFRHMVGNLSSLCHNNVWDIELDAEGGLWVGTLGGGLDYLPPGQSSFRHFAPVPGDPNSLSSVQIVDVLLSKDQRYLWAASEDRGLNRVEVASGQIKRFTQESPGTALGGNNLQCLFEDSRGLIWIGSEFKGLDCLDPRTGEARHFTTANGLPSNMVNSISEDADGFLWIGTQRGTVRLDPGSGAVSDFGTDHSLRNNQYNPRASLRLADGRLVFGGTNGFSVLKPSEIRPNQQPPKLIFTALRVAGQPVSIGKWNGRTVLNGNLNDPGTTVRLSYADRGIVFEFTSSDYTLPMKNRFAYRLDGFDKEWDYAGAEQRRAIFSSLKGGQYLLRVKAANNDGVWGEESRLRIVVALPLWERWWFLLLCSGIAAGVGYLIFRYFLEHEKAVFQEKAFRAEEEVLRLRNENLEREIASEQAKLSATVLQSAHKNQFLADLKAQIQKIDGAATAKDIGHPDLRKVIRAIDAELNQADYWEQFQLSFNQTHQNFVQKLQDAHPTLTNNEVRLCCFVRMGLSNPEIASILNITVNGVEQSKYRLKRKLGLDRELALNDYIRFI